ncbi:DUF6356 family protein [Novosphingobium sp. fls2-241-R2A-195]|uniref:DUF6356 family protein n=1 Tax=Novosphingobium sp. fls2-241-R2A-195 TaxID=3040296 RepID=UPI00254CE477|nr:DUF6356 family protein [Novosphingobium sp. fls2-241-R2A-195]
MFNKLFVDHPGSVHETYGEHWYVANRFGVLMLKAGLAAIVHGFIPGLLTRTGSDIVKKLHDEMTNRGSHDQLKGHTPRAKAWHLEYEI